MEPTQRERAVLVLVRHDARDVEHRAGTGAPRSAVVEYHLAECLTCATSAVKHPRDGWHSAGGRDQTTAPIPSASAQGAQLTCMSLTARHSALPCRSRSFGGGTSIRSSWWAWMCPAWSTGWSPRQVRAELETAITACVRTPLLAAVTVLLWVFTSAHAPRLLSSPGWDEMVYVWPANGDPRAA